MQLKFSVLHEIRFRAVCCRRSWAKLDVTLKSWLFFVLKWLISEKISFYTFDLCNCVCTGRRVRLFPHNVTWAEIILTHKHTQAGRQTDSSGWPMISLVSFSRSSFLLTLFVFVDSFPSSSCFIVKETTLRQTRAAFHRLCWWDH